MSRPRVLLVWGDDRRGFVEPFEKLSDRFDFVYLSRMAPSPDDVRATDAPAVYWIDHRSAGSLLDATKPSRIPTSAVRNQFPPEMFAAITQAVQVGGVTEASVAQ